MTHRSETERSMVVNFVNGGGRFQRYVRPMYKLSSRIIRPSGHLVTNLYTNDIIDISFLPVPGTSGYLHGWSDGSSPITLENHSEVTTVAYRNDEMNFEYAAVTWHPDEWGSDAFNRQENNVHTIQRFSNAKIVVPMRELEELIEQQLILLSRNGNVMHINPQALAQIVNNYGHYSSHKNVSESL